VQLYAVPPAGSPDDHPGAFHRALFLFVAPTAREIGGPGGVRVFRCQLPRYNHFYATEPSDELLPRPLADVDASASLERDPWQVLEHERNCKSNPSGGLPQFREWVIEVRPDGSSSEV
jgi:pre-rRNA-processing protein TSR4